MSPGPQGVQIVGLADFRRDLKAVGDEWPKELRKVNKAVADKARDWARGEASSLGGVHAKASPAIKSFATATQAKVGVTVGDRRYPFAAVATWGAKRRTGWYAARRYTNSPRQHPPWVGNTWDTGVAGQGPYAINSAIARHERALAEMYMDGIEELAARAFPTA